jgi:glycosyltransferase involved in cell wall biosynthesis
MSTPNLSIVLPCYNEAGNIPLIFSRFREVIGDREDIEVVMVNNGSTDDSAEILAAEAARPENAFARVATVAINQGYGYGIMSGVRVATGEFIAWTHADMQTDPNDVLLGYEMLREAGESGAVVLKGRRRNRALLDDFFTWGMAVISSIALGARLDDINAQPKMFHRRFLEKMASPPDDFSLDLYFLYLAHKLGVPIVEQPVIFGERQHGEAKGGGTMKGKIKLIRRTLGYVFKLRSDIRQGSR